MEEEWQNRGSLACVRYSIKGYCCPWEDDVSGAGRLSCGGDGRAVPLHSARRQQPCSQHADNSRVPSHHAWLLMLAGGLGLICQVSPPPPSLRHTHIHLSIWRPHSTVNKPRSMPPRTLRLAWRSNLATTEMGPILSRTRRWNDNNISLSLILVRSCLQLYEFIKQQAVMSAFGISDDFKGSIPYPPGSQLASEGPYRDAIEALISKYPILNFSEDFKSPVIDSCIHQLRSRAAFYSFEGPGAQKLPEIFDDATKLQRALDRTGLAPAAGSSKQLLILEDLDPTFVSVIGHEWQVDPGIFMRHKVNGLWNMDHQGTTPIAIPSSINPGTFFNIQYQEMRFFTDELPSESLRTAGNYRNIATTSIGRHRDQTGIVNLKASFWSRKLPQSGWQGKSTDRPTLQ